MAANRLVEMDAFVRVARNQNFIAAASELRVSAGLVTRRLQHLEHDLGVRLISRTTRRLSLTEAGRRYYEFCTRILKEVHEEESAIKRVRDEPVGRLTVVAPMSFGIMEMGKAVTSFMLQYPKIQVTLIIGDNGRRTFDPAEYGADVIIRFTQPKDTSLYLRKIGRMSWTLCASRTYLRKAGTPEKTAEPGSAFLPRHHAAVWKQRLEVSGPDWYRKSQSVGRGLAQQCDHHAFHGARWSWHRIASDFLRRRRYSPATIGAAADGLQRARAKDLRLLSTRTSAAAEYAPVSQVPREKVQKRVLGCRL